MRMIEGVETETIDFGTSTITLAHLEMIVDLVRRGKPVLLKNPGVGGVTLMEMGAYLAGLALDAPWVNAEAKASIEQFRMPTGV